MLDYLIPYLTRTFSFDPNSPLLFTQFYFWGFFAVVFAIFSLVHSKLLLRNAFLFATSLFFYYKTSGSYVCILIFCVIANFFIGKWIEKAQAHWKKKVPDDYRRHHRPARPLLLQVFLLLPGRPLRLYRHRAARLQLLRRRKQQDVRHALARRYHHIARGHLVLHVPGDELLHRHLPR